MNYAPHLLQMPTGPVDRFARLRVLLSDWYGVSIPSSGEPSIELQRIEHQAGQKMPVAIREWMQLTADLSLPECGEVGEVLRDGRRIEWEASLDGLSLNLQAEGDIHWAVDASQLEFEDPVVSFYLMDWSAKPRRFTLQAHPHECVSSFAWGYLTGYIASQHGFRAEITDRDTLVAVLASEGHIGSPLAYRHLVGGQDWFAVISDGSDTSTQRPYVSVRYTPDAESMPQALRGLRSSISWRGTT